MPQEKAPHYAGFFRVEKRSNLIVNYEERNCVLVIVELSGGGHSVGANFLTA